MHFDLLTVLLTVWGIATLVAIFAVTACSGCCIKKLLGRPCSKK